MPWANDPESRRRSDATYSDPEYKRNRRIVLTRANGRCSRCGRRRTLQVDHVIPVSQGGSHAVANLQVLCSGPGSCHAKKTATEGGGWRGSRTVNDPQPVQRTQW